MPRTLSTRTAPRNRATTGSSSGLAPNYVNALRKSAMRSESGFLQRPHQLWLEPFWSECSWSTGLSQLHLSAFFIVWTLRIAADGSAC